MNITYLFGNGFDVNLGLPTKYTDYYPIYKETIKDILENDDFESELPNQKSIRVFWSQILEEYDNWADFEEAIALLAKGDENDIKYVLSDFTVKFSNYLLEKQESIECSDEVMSDFVDFLLHGQNNLQRHDKELMEPYKIGIKSENYSINIVTFNYTNSIEQILDKCKSNIIARKKDTNYISKINSQILHIHGTLEDGDSVIIGIDSIDQFEDENLKHNTAAGAYCVKTQINNDIGFSSRENQFRQLISSSQIVYAYGIAFGKTDKSRWKVLSDWLQASSTHKLVVYYFDEDFRKIKSTYARDLLDYIDEIKKSIMQKIGLDLKLFSRYKDQIFIIDSSSVLKTQFTIRQTITN